MSQNIPPFSIEIRPRDAGRYKSIENLSWRDIPGLAILTGKNGSGKTQLLELLAYHFSGALPRTTPQTPHLPVEVITSGCEYTDSEIGYVPSSGVFSGGGSSITNLQNLRAEALQLAQAANINQYDINTTIRSKKILKRLSEVSIYNVSPKELEEILSDDFEFVIDDMDITKGLSHLFLAHRLKRLEAIERGSPEMDREGRPLGLAPWDVVNESLRIAGFPYEVMSPQNTPILGVYELKFQDRQDCTVIHAVELSSGERILLQLVLWLFTASKNGLFPKLLLLDEPDAHLHPSMTTQFLDVVSDVLVNKYGVRVIMTTHSPSTVALAPEGSIFEIKRGEVDVTRVVVRADTIAMLTSGLVTVSRSTKFCFVEDQEDVAFYETIYDILLDKGPSQDPMALKASPSIAFIPASIGTGPAKISGGWSVVTKWVDKLDTDPLDRTFFGIIDRDSSNVSTKRVLTIGRYSYENYILDPTVIFALVLEDGNAPILSGVNITPGDEHQIRLLNDTQLQSIVDTVCEKMCRSEPSLSMTPTTTVRYTNGVTVEAPLWVENHQGHSLLRVAQIAFGGSRVVTPPRLLKALRRCRLLPVELAILMKTLQSV